ASKTNEITEWIRYFVYLLHDAQNTVHVEINFIVKKKKFLDQFAASFNERQMKVIKRMLRTEPKGFEGGINAKKYMAMTGTSKATATRDLQSLLAMKAIQQIGDGRGTRYELVL